jgi:hypothetical protein
MGITVAIMKCGCVSTVKHEIWKPVTRIKYARETQMRK